MYNTEVLEPSNSWWVFRVYAILFGLTGFVLLGWEAYGSAPTFRASRMAKPRSFASPAPS
jgi:hypothetical protein